MLTPLTAISPVDGRYRNKTEKLADYFSEQALIRYRIRVEVEYFIALCEIPLPQLAGIDRTKFAALRALYLDFSPADAERVKQIESVTNHDVKAIEYILAHDCVEVFNLGTGTPYSVTEIVETFEKVNNVPVPHEYGPRRAGDLPESYANADKALRVLGWKTEKSLADMCRDTWNWQKNNPNGYQK